MATGTARSIGQVLTLLRAEFPDVTISKIRFLETQGLLHPERTASGYRKFHDGDVEQLRWVLAQQRDQFLPLKVIKDKLDAGEWGEQPGDGAPPPARSGRDHPFDAGPSDVHMSRDELLGASRLEPSQLAELEKAGLVVADKVGGEVAYDADALLAARAAAGLLDRGFEVRHLRSYRVAAEREAGMIEQIVVPITRHGGADGHRRAGEMLGQLISLGDDLRRATLRRTLRKLR